MVSIAAFTSSVLLPVSGAKPLGPKLTCGVLTLRASQDCLSASCIRLYAPNILTCNILNTSTLSIQLVSDEYLRLSKFLKI